MGEASLYAVHCLGEIVRGEQEMDVIRHHDEGVEFVKAFCSVVLQGFDQEVGVCFDLKESAAVVGDCSEEEGACVGGSRRGCHRFSLFDWC